MFPCDCMRLSACQRDQDTYTSIRCYCPPEAATAIRGRAVRSVKVEILHLDTGMFPRNTLDRIQPPQVKWILQQ